MCARRKLPFLHIESVEISPERLRAGEEFNHRWVYSLCPVTPTSVVTGRLDTRIFFKGRPIVHDHNDPFELKPGRWVVDSFVTVPPGAQTGVYSIEIGFQGRPLRFSRRNSFAVQAGAK